MKVYSIEREKYLESTLEGIGASKSRGFRWNSLYTRMVYTAASRALAMLEVAVHLDLNEDLPSDRFFVEIDIPESVKIIQISSHNLPRDWNEKPPSTSTQLIGDDFVKQGSAAILKIPSAIIPQEFNYLINPLHPDAKKITITETTPFKFDDRLQRDF